MRMIYAPHTVLTVRYRRVAQRTRYLKVRRVHVAVGSRRVVVEAALGHALVPAHISAAETMGLRLAPTSCVDHERI